MAYSVLMRFVSSRACDTSAFCKYELLSKRSTGTSGSQLLTFKLPSTVAFDSSALSSSVYVQLPGSDGIAKSYSPVSRADVTGHFDLLVKPYPPRPGGGLGAYLCELKPGERATLRMKPPRIIHGSTAFAGRWSQLVLLAAGTGIAPFVQILRHFLHDGRTSIWLIYSTRAGEDDLDILMKEEIDKMAATYPALFQVQYVVTGQGGAKGGAETGTKRECTKGESEASAALALHRGRVDLPLLRTFLPSAESLHAAGGMVMVCGTDDFVQSMAGTTIRVKDATTGKMRKEQGSLTGLLAEAGYSSHAVYKF